MILFHRVTDAQTQVDGRNIFFLFVLLYFVFQSSIMDRLQLAAPPAPLSMSVPNESGYVPANSGGGSGGAFTNGAVGTGSLVDFLTGRIDFSGVPDAMANAATSEDDLIRAPSFYDQTLTPSVMMPQQSLNDSTPLHDDAGAMTSSDYPWMKDKKVARKNQCNNFFEKGAQRHAPSARTSTRS